MNQGYAPRHTIQLPEGTIVEHPPALPEKVTMGDPATMILIDFTHNRPPTVSPSTTIDHALKKSKSMGAHLLLVVDTQSAIIGQVSSGELLGEKPVRLAQETGVPHDQITVDQVMTPRKELMAIEWAHVENAKVGHIVNTLHQQECCSLLVVEGRLVRGIFCATEISRHLGRPIEDCVHSAHSMAEIVHVLEE